MDILDDLRRRVVEGEFAYGEKLRAELLKTDYDCSAAVIRETLLRLSELGLVEFQEQRGFRMPQWSEDLQHDITEMRILLETEGAVRSLKTGSVAWEAGLTAAHHKLAHIESRIISQGSGHDLTPLWLTAELEFHRALVGACGSPLLTEMHMQIFHRYRQIRFGPERSFPHIVDNMAEHTDIVEAALDGDTDQLRTAIRAHFQRQLKPGATA